MRNILESVEAFTQRNQQEPHKHITLEEAQDFYISSTEGLIGPQKLLQEATNIIVGCTACSAVFTEAHPSRQWTLR
jgi:hypothetical protein